MLGSILYAALGTRPDLAFTAAKLGQFASCATQEHWEAMQWAFQYINATASYGIVYDGSEPWDFHGYTDSDYAQCLAPPPDRRKSTSGYTWQMCGASVSWSSKLQPTIALSSTEAEVIASNHAGKEGVWLRKLLQDLSSVISTQTEKPRITTLFADNQSAMVICNEPGNQQRTKHFDTQWFWIRERIANGELRLVYKSTLEMTADICTKSLPRPTHNRHCKFLGLRKSAGEIPDK